MVVESEEPDQPLAFSAGLRCSRFEVETALDERLALVEVPVSKAAVPVVVPRGGWRSLSTGSNLQML